MGEGIDKDMDELGEVVKRFPQSEAGVRSLFDQDEDFRELCSDYCECLSVIQRIRRESGGSHSLLEEYCEARVHLEQELLSRLSMRGRHTLKPEN